MRMTKASKELIEKRASLMKEFNEHREQRIQQWKEQKTRRLELRNSMFQLFNYLIILRYFDQIFFEIDS